MVNSLRNVNPTPPNDMVAGKLICFVTSCRGNSPVMVYFPASSLGWILWETKVDFGYVLTSKKSGDFR